MPSLPASPAPLRLKPAHPASAALFGHAAGDACCTPPPDVAIPAAPHRPRRLTLADLDLHLHCSIIGTCLSTGELRKLVPRYQRHIDRQKASDLDIHHTAVEMCCEQAPGWKEINKALDTRHTLVIKRFKAAADEDALLALWKEAMASGEVPGAYWALMTHPCATPDARAVAFGDVHMLSHLVGAANRADIRRLVALEEESQALRQQNERQQARLHEMAMRHAGEVGALEEQVQALDSQCRRQQAPAKLEARLAQAGSDLAERDSRLALHIARCEVAERRAQGGEDLLRSLQERLARMEEELGAARAETQSVEQALNAALAEDGSGSALPSLAGQCIAYVGGRPGAVATLARLVADAGGQLLAHDGGLEDRRGALATTLARTQTVLFPVDCISHSAMYAIKRSCEQNGAANHPLRSYSVASAILTLQRLFAQPTATSNALQSRFCLRHG